MNEKRIKTLEALEIRINGLTAGFRVPIAASGVLPSIPVPGYTHLLGFLSNCAGRTILPEETKIGFEYTILGKGMDKERIVRWNFNYGNPKLNPKGSAVRNKEFHYGIELLLYITNLNLRKCLYHPKGVICLGQSQDVVWIDDIKDVILEERREGLIGGTLIPFNFRESNFSNGQIFMLPEFYQYTNLGAIRKIGKMNRFIATTNSGKKQKIRNSNLFHIKGDLDEKRVIYIHEFD